MSTGGRKTRVFRTEKPGFFRAFSLRKTPPPLGPPRRCTAWPGPLRLTQPRLSGGHADRACCNPPVLARLSGGVGHCADAPVRLARTRTIAGADPGPVGIVLVAACVAAACDLAGGAIRDGWPVAWWLAQAGPSGFSGRGDRCRAVHADCGVDRLGFRAGGSAIRGRCSDAPRSCRGIFQCCAADPSCLAGSERLASAASAACAVAARGGWRRCT